MKKKVFRLLIKKVKSIEKANGSLEDFVVSTTFLGVKHTMKMEDDSSVFESLNSVYQDLSDLEMADLVDLQKNQGEYGKFGKTRRHIFC